MCLQTPVCVCCLRGVCADAEVSFQTVLGRRSPKPQVSSTCLKSSGDMCSPTADRNAFKCELSGGPLAQPAGVCATGRTPSPVGGLTAPELSRLPARYVRPDSLT